MLSAQGLEYDKSKLVGMTPVKVNMMEAAGGFNAELTQIAAPPPSGTSYRDELARQKAKSAALYLAELHRIYKIEVSWSNLL